ncbi:TIGR03619 family F420-dependent LLM class oxidoreductase [Actinoplanes sp. NPDC049596]|uniref:TIGR03619 family F420-dependent LLM class oxidoreductase n=1 Tax=unclassified Actinoplanes TaxID=2626549 RepID=UPI003448DFAD
MPFKLGVNLPQSTNYDLAEDIVAAARAAEQIGYDSVWAFERVLFPHDQTGSHGLYGVPDLPWPAVYSAISDPLVTLAMAAAVTRRVELGTGVLLPPLHLPVKLAKTMASLDHSSRGRFIAGLGSGWSIDEYAAASPRPFAERGAALDEFLDVAAAVWGTNPVTVDTGRYRIDQADVNPKPARRIPLYLAGSNGTAMLRIARRADGWLPTGISPAQAVAGLGLIREMAEAAGREPTAVGCIFQVSLRGPLVEVPAEGRQPFTGSVDQVTTDITELAAGGIEHAYLTLPYVSRDRNEYFDRMAEIHAAVRGAGL